MPEAPPTPTSTSTAAATPHRIVAAAEKLYSENGFHAMTLRDVTREAGVNLAAVNYHFGSKIELVRAVLRRRFEPINQVRLARLDGLVARYSPDPIPLDEIFSALIRPLFEGSANHDGTDPGFMHLVARAITEPADFIRPLHREFFGEVTRRFLIELKRTCRELDDDQLHYRLYLTVSTMIGSIVHLVCLESISSGKLGRRNLDSITDALIHYTVAGFRNPSNI